MDERQPEYRSYLLRLWWASEKGALILRIFVEDPHTGERQAFAGLEELIAFLREEIGLDDHTQLG